MCFFLKIVTKCARSNMISFCKKCHYRHVFPMSLGCIIGLVGFICRVYVVHLDDTEFFIVCGNFNDPCDHLSGKDPSESGQSIAGKALSWVFCAHLALCTLATSVQRRPQWISAKNLFLFSLLSQDSAMPFKAEQ